MSSPTKRGLFLVFEGLDRSGKSTQSARLAQFLEKSSLQVKKICFPNRETAIGSTINGYLQKKADLSDQAIHLLFSANRWEVSVDVEKWLASGTHIVCDRYAFSGVAYSAAKGLDFGWCQQPDVGLPAPDKVFYLNVSQELAAQRSGFGEERYEKAEFQTKVGEQFEKFKGDKFWQVLDAGREMDELENEIRKVVEGMIEGQRGDVERLWTNSGSRGKEEVA